LTLAAARSQAPSAATCALEATALTRQVSDLRTAATAVAGMATTAVALAVVPQAALTPAEARAAATAANHLLKVLLRETPGVHGNSGCAQAPLIV
jgi:hypothetical protein